MKKKFNLENKTIIITGGASGIGKAIGLATAEQGANIIILDLNKKEILKTVGEVKKNGSISEGYLCDVSNQSKVFSTIKKISKTHSIDVLINCAGISHIGSIESVNEESLDNLYSINIKGIYNCIKACIPKMKKNKSGIIINLASIAGSVGISDRFAYSMTKGAVLSMTLSVAKDYIDHGIRCNSISPARVHTPFVDKFLKQHFPGKEAEVFEKLSNSQPIGRMGSPKEIADLALYLCSDESSFITGTDFPIDGGFIKLNN